MVRDMESCKDRENVTPARRVSAIAANAFMEVWLERKEATHKVAKRAMRDEKEKDVVEEEGEGEKGEEEVCGDEEEDDE